MQQSLENVISRLQKMYQLKSSELEQIKEDLKLRKIATALANFKDHDELSTYDKEKIKIFLTKSGSRLDIDAVSLACTIVDLANPVIKTSKRYIEASKILEEVKKEAIKCMETNDDLFLKQTKCETTLQTMEEMFNVLTNKVVVNEMDLNKYINLLENEIFQDDKYSVLVVVAALVIRNAALLNTADKNETSVKRDKVEILSNEQKETRESYRQFIKELEPLYSSRSKGLVTNTYLKNLETLIEKDKANLEEVQTMLHSDSSLYEYFIWNWMSKLVEKMDDVTTQNEVNNIIKQLDKLKEKYNELVEKDKISKIVKEQLNNNKIVLYQINDEGELPKFEYKQMTSETASLLKQIEEIDDINSLSNITPLSEDLNIIIGDKEFILFKNLSNNHILVLLNDKIEEMDKTLDANMLVIVMNPKSFEHINDMIEKNTIEYRKMLQSAEMISSIINKLGQ